MGSRVRDFYTSKYPTDSLGVCINGEVTFRELFDGMKRRESVYDLMGVGDSLIRERVFEHMSEVLGVDYYEVYDLWLHGDWRRESGVVA